MGLTDGWITTLLNAPPPLLLGGGIKYADCTVTVMKILQEHLCNLRLKVLQGTVRAQVESET